jgi:DNA topoisomerase-1
MLKIPLKGKGEKYTAEDLQDISFDEVKKWIIAQDETAFKEKPKAKKRLPRKLQPKNLLKNKVSHGY